MCLSGKWPPADVSGTLAYIRCPVCRICLRTTRGKDCRGESADDCIRASLLAPMASTISAGAANLVAILLGNGARRLRPARRNCGRPVRVPTIHSGGAGAALVARGHARGQFVVTAVSAALRAVFVTLAALTGSLTMVIVATSAALGCSALLYAFPFNPILKASLADLGLPCTHRAGLHRRWPDADRVGLRAGELRKERSLMACRAVRPSGPADSDHWPQPTR